RLLADCGAHVVGSDQSAAMLGVAWRRMEPSRASQVCLLQADGRAVPVKGGWAKMAIAGWVYGHFVEWYRDRWQAEIARALTELERTLERGGRTILIETLGTGHQEPQAPTDGLERYYRWLEAEQSFRHEWVRTDYLFASVEEAAEVTGFFFGPEFAERVRREGWQRVPECTGMWWKHKQ
ncbi:MAG TPA: methyltransferase domain-containing protein, partial [Aggregatilineales bacterium]|nr:methyltransferase domain-containing protein [Aggregatilineales bacterium]